MHSKTSPELQAEREIIAKKVWGVLKQISIQQAAKFILDAYPARPVYADIARKAAAAHFGLSMPEWKALTQLARGEWPEITPGIDLDAAARPCEADREGAAGECVLRFRASMVRGSSLHPALQSIENGMKDLWGALGIDKNKLPPLEKPTAEEKKQKQAPKPETSPQEKALVEKAKFEAARAAFWSDVEESIAQAKGVSLTDVDQVLKNAQYAAPWKPSDVLERALARAGLSAQDFNDPEKLSAMVAAVSEKNSAEKSAEDAAREAKESGEIRPAARCVFEPKDGWPAEKMTAGRALVILCAEKTVAARLQAEFDARRAEQKAAEEKEKAEQKEAARKAREKEAVLRQREREMIAAPDMPAHLGITPTEYERWEKDGKIPVSKHKDFYKWGRSLQLRLHHPDDLKHVTPAKIKKWREEHQADLAKKRKASAQTAKKARAWTLGINKALAAGFTPVSGEARNGEDGVTDAWWAARQVSIALDGETHAVMVSQPVRLPQRPKLTDPATLATRLAAVSAKVSDAKLAAAISPPIKAVMDSLQMGPAPTGAAAADPDHDDHDPKWSALFRLFAQGLAPESWEKPGLKEHLLDAERQHAEEGEMRRAQRGFHLEDYPASFPQARSIGRSIRVVCGPTNSGKTHEALEALKAAKSGVYLAPLRLLAMEVYDRLTAAGIPCELRTGEERVITPGAKHVCATVEMMNPAHEVEVAVIDECQMLHDEQRGFAWTAALAGVPAKRVYALGSKWAAPSIQRLAAHLGEACEVVEVERKTELLVLPQPLDEDDVRAGDAVVAFSRRGVLRLSARFRDMGLSVATIYGALTPEVRRHQAHLFNSGAADVLVATDAIGMGMNLPIARVLFSEIEKFDGEEMRRLLPSEAQQIGGRAGRYGLHEKGEVGTLSGASARELKSLLKAKGPEPLERLPVGPSLAYALAISERLGISSLSEILLHFEEGFQIEHALFEKALSSDMMGLAELTDRFEDKLSLAIRFKYACAPVSLWQERELGYWGNVIAGHASGAIQRIISLPAWVNDVQSAGSRDLLDEAEGMSKIVGIYAWLAHAFPSIFVDAGKAPAAREKLARYINAALKKQEEPRYHRRRWDEYGSFGGFGGHDDDDDDDDDYSY